MSIEDDNDDSDEDSDDTDDDSTEDSYDDTTGTEIEVDSESENNLQERRYSTGEAEDRSIESEQDQVINGRP